MAGSNSWCAAQLTAGPGLVLAPNPPEGDNPGVTKGSKPAPDIAYYDNGGVRYRGFQLDGKPHGAWEFLRKDGSVMRAGEFDHGKQIGIWRTLDRGGRVVKETHFSPT